VRRLTRSRRLPAAILCCTSLLLFAGCRNSPQKETIPAKRVTPESQPARSVLLLVVDTLPAHTLHCYGEQRQTSPAIDELAGRGVLFERVYAASNWTVPSTASFLTSLYPLEHGAGMSGKIHHLSGKNPPNRLADRFQTLAEILSKRGIATAMFSANPYLGAGLQQGYEKHVIQRMSAKALTDQTLDWLHTHAGSPFFVHLQYMDLHIPVEPPPEFAGLFARPGDDMKDPSLAYWRFQKGMNLEGEVFESYRRRRIAIHDGAMRYIDSQISRLLSGLEDLGCLKNTVVIVTSDHGEEFWEHAAEEKAFGNDPRDIYGVGHGHAMYEELLRVPLIFSGAGIRPHVSITKTAGLLDLAPTILDLLGFPIPADMHGISLLPQLRHASRDEGSSSRIFLAQSPAYGPDSTALISGNNKLIHRVDGIDLLFDLKSDPGEHTDLSHSDSKRLETLLAKMKKIEAELTPAGSGKKLKMDASTEEQLRTLGYIE